MGKTTRPTEPDYLRTLADRCDLGTWGLIVDKAVELAKGGDAQARAWIGRYLCAEATLNQSLTHAERLANLHV